MEAAPLMILTFATVGVRPDVKLQSVVNDKTRMRDGDGMAGKARHENLTDWGRR
jgi:hypothetical protein